ncbi:ketoacyl-synthetase C-terminal extension domain-containing protein [Actinokineospora soli]|uniref:Ketoacyl-synthetase C-terminal extension domain-containing protein n=1 Tax=Actinokineospora soli TaxID=1048753 RepID=A0ABW2TN92_9PSEU
MRHGVVPASAAAETPTTRVAWPDTVHLLSRPTLWPPQDRPRRAAVSTFGAGGGNAHVVLEQAPEVPPDDDAPVPLPFRVTGRTPRALREHARALLAHLDTHHLLPLYATAATLATGRTRFEHRAVVVARDHAGLRAGLAEVAAGATGLVGDPVDEPDWTGARRVELPTHPFQRERYWLYDHARGAPRTALSP